MPNIAKPDANGNNIEFDNAYWAHWPPPVQKLQTISDPTARRLAAILAAEQGYLIDNSIMVWGWDPFKTMEAREQYGYTTVPSAFQPNVTAAPGVTIPGGSGVGPSDTGALKVSLDFDDFPPYKAA